MILAKRFADLLTASRIMVALVIAWLGLLNADWLLPIACFLLLGSWTSDLLDGILARRSGAEPTWIGDHDLEIDVAVSLGVLIYLIGADFLEPAYVGAYVLLWALIFRRWGWRRDPAMLFQAPIYLWFIVVGMRDAPQAAWWLIAWIVTAIVITWPRFPRDIVPGFLAGMAKVMKSE